MTNLTIVGTGAMACLFGARLAQHAQVTLLGTWGEAIQAINAGGIRLDQGDSELLASVRATEDPLDCAGTELALVTVKSWQTQRAADQLAECLAEHGVALTLQNGLGNAGTLRDRLGDERVAMGVTTMGATLLGPGRVRLGGAGPTHLADHPRLTAWAQALEQAEFDVEIAPHLEGLMWGKLAVNAGINPLTALLEVPNGALLESESAERLMVAAAQETAQVALALGIELHYADAGQVVRGVAERTAGNRSSMLQDIQRGAPTEIEAISGAIVQAAERAGKPAPINHALWQLVRAKVELAGR